jgi:hypothetical protein
VRVGWFAGQARCGHASCPAGAHGWNINGYGVFRGSPHASTVPLRGGAWNVWGGARGASFGTLLGPEATGPYLAAMRDGAGWFLLFPHFTETAHVCVVLVGDGVVV